jgi:excisionase family DNA binding protein
MADLSQVLKELKELRAELRAGAKRLLPIPEAAEYLGLAPRTVRNELSRKTFPVKPVKHGGKILFRREDLDAYIDGLGADA